MPIEHKFTNRHTIASYFASAHVHNGVCLGGSEHQILAVAGLTHAQLKHPKSRVLATQLASIVKSCWRLSGDELLGFTQQKVKLGMFTLLAERLIRCKSLEEVLVYSDTFYSLTGDQLQIKTEQCGSQVRVTVNANFKSNSESIAVNSLLIELLLLICHRFPSWLVGRVIPLSQIHVKHRKPAHHEEYRLMFPCPCIYQSTHNMLVFDSKYLDLPVVQTAQEWVKYANHIPLQWFKKQSYYDTCSTQVLRVLENSLLGKESNLDNVAVKLNMTSRTLRRKLIIEGSRFQQLKDNTRRDKAIHLFEQANLTIAQIGLAVGFTELATFSRAFKHWTGVSPNTYRNHHLLTACGTKN
jgi:AraC-like DNA-binding protein